MLAPGRHLVSQFSELLWCSHKGFVTSPILEEESETETKELSKSQELPRPKPDCTMGSEYTAAAPFAGQAHIYLKKYYFLGSI